MGLRLWILSRWTPPAVLKLGLADLADHTIRDLIELLKAADPDRSGLYFNRLSDLGKGDLGEQRQKMAGVHAELTAALIENLGAEEAIRQGRERMFRTGVELGRKYRRLLGVGETVQELVAAATILYAALGIDFSVEPRDRWRWVMTVHRCSLAKAYDADTCRMLSAADEGVVQGLNSATRMRFTAHLTGGCSCCTASIEMAPDKIEGERSTAD
ncbi:L-2-amino-thiazoline-4-carboxylic acid hydrolase [candidate division KSB1 bacterium]|nr:L-2-amino-thiazoline-4-carboxylic acid hydrolase [candidate division KSB1 bacterium]